MRASKQKGFSKRKFLDTTDDKSAELESKPKKAKSEDTTDSKKSSKSPKEPKIAQNVPKIYNKDGNIVYSKFDLVSTAANPLADKRNSKKNKLQNLLVKSQKEEKRLSELEVKNPAKAQDIKEKKKWKKAIDLSEGLKVKDNSKLIKKSLMKKRKDKQKSGKKWTERNEAVEKSMAAHQQKREKHISERKQKKKDMKLKHLRKKGRIVT